MPAAKLSLSCATAVHKNCRVSVAHVEIRKVRAQNRPYNFAESVYAAISCKDTTRSPAFLKLVLLLSFDGDRTQLVCNLLVVKTFSAELCGLLTQRCKSASRNFFVNCRTSSKSDGSAQSGQSHFECICSRCVAS
eukprot:COSAG06_NODE_9732_length_1830_cov_7.186107_1_plen_135_part_00